MLSSFSLSDWKYVKCLMNIHVILTLTVVPTDSVPRTHVNTSNV